MRLLACAVMIQPNRIVATANKVVEIATKTPAASRIRILDVIITRSDLSMSRSRRCGCGVRGVAANNPAGCGSQYRAVPSHSWAGAHEMMVDGEGTHRRDRATPAVAVQ